jgi:hypothetical protein
MKARRFLQVQTAVALLIGLCSAIRPLADDGVPGRVTTLRPELTGQVVKAQIDGSGTIHLLVQGKDGPQYARSQDNGRTFSAPISIVDEKARKPGLEFQGEDMAVGKNGRVFIAMSNNAWKLKLPEREWGLYFATLLPGAKDFTATRNLNLKPSEGFSIAADKSGSVTASFLSDKLFAKVSRDNGETFSGNAEPNPAWDPCNCCTTSAAYGSDGKLAILYREETNNERDMYLVLWNQATGEPPVRTRVSEARWHIDACPMTYFSIKPTDFGYVAAWPTKGQIYFARLDKDGRMLPPGEIKTPGTNGMRTGVIALGAKDGATLVAWKNNHALGWQLYGADGGALGESGFAPSFGNNAAGVTLPNGSFLLFL